MIVDNLASESSFEVDFGEAASVVRHDKLPGDGNVYWPGVDFRVSHDGRVSWIEVCNYSAPNIPEEKKIEVQERFLEDLKSKKLRRELVSKFLGTSAFLAWSKNFEPQETIYVILFQHPPGTTIAEVEALNMYLQGSFPNKMPFTEAVSVVLLTPETWSKFFPNFPLKVL